MTIARFSLARAAIALAALATASARGADVTASLSTDEVYVGMPFSLIISVEGSDQVELPEIPAVPGLGINPNPGRSTRSMTQLDSRGRLTRFSAVDLSYQVVARRSGSFTIPSIDLTVDGRVVGTQAITFVAVDSPTGDRVVVEVAAPRRSYYLGERVEAVLQLWIKRDERGELALSGQQMWNQVAIERSSWGPFRAALENRSVSVRSSSRLDEDGRTASYFVYELPVELRPERAGPIAFEDVAIVVDYPTSIRTSRDIFNRVRLAIDRSQPAVGRVSGDPIVVKALPERGRPASFGGAVGRFGLDVTASPTQVAVGDPITLTMVLTDLLQGASDLSRAPAPDLRDLEGSFRVPQDPIGGLVDGARKTFRQTIRATSADVTEVPPIVLTYFDPIEERYATVRSDPIAITVSSVESVRLDEVVGAGPDAGRGPTELTELAGGLVANYTDADLLRAPARPRAWPFVVALLLPPIAFAATCAVQHRARRRASSGAAIRRRGAARTARRRLDASAGANGAARSQLVASVVAGYVADRLDLAGEALTGDEIVERLLAASVAADVVDEVAELMRDCERRRYGGDASSADGLDARARSCIDRLEREVIA